MAKPVLIGPVPGTTPSNLDRSSSRGRALPEDLLRDASRRLGIMSLLGAALWTVGPVLGHLARRALDPNNPSWALFGATDVIAVACIVLSLLLYWYTRRSRSEPGFVLDLGLAYMVLIALALGLMMHWNAVSWNLSLQPTITWVGAVVLMFAAVMPNAPVKVLIAGLIAASMNPISMLVAQARGTWEFGPPINALAMHYPDYILVGVAVVISRVMTTLGQQVARAREMGSYRLGELLGRGGMGEVYRATHRLLARPAAIKLIRPEMLAAGGRQAARVAAARFRREAEAAASLRSPHTVELYDFGVTDDETLYFVMELLEGMNLETLVRQHGPLPASRTIHILRQVCESLAEAHAYGLVHRDIKPANIHLGRVGLRHDFVKVLDFGLVKTIVDRGDEQSLATAQGMTPGTPSYMAPEMAFGDKVDGRADLYALGCVAYFLLTGQLVFEAENTLQMVAKHLQAVPVAPSRRTTRPIPPALDQLVLACLAKEPADRPANAATLAERLAMVVVEPWDEEQARQWWSVNAPATSPEIVQAEDVSEAKTSLVRERRPAGEARVFHEQR